MVKGIGAKLNLKILTDFNFYFRGFEFHPDNEMFNRAWVFLFLYTQYPKWSDHSEPGNCPCLFFSLRKLLRNFNFFICSFVLISFKDTPWVFTKWELASRVVLSANLICLIISWKQDPAKNTTSFQNNQSLGLQTRITHLVSVNKQKGENGQE